MDRIINILLLVIIFVFDPLAISLVVAANFAFDQIRPKIRENLYGEKVNMRQSFGTEGVTYRYDENGNIRQITVPDDFDITRTDGGGNTRLVGITMYSQDTWLNETGLESIKVWAKDDYSGKIPSGITMTAEEGDLVSRYKTDLQTYSLEMISKFIAGVEPIEKYDAFVDQMVKLKVNELIGVYQDAVARFMAR